MAPNTGFRVHTPFDPVLCKVIAPVRRQAAIRLIPMPVSGFEPPLGGVTVHAEPVAMTAVAHILGLRSVGSVPEKETIGVMESAMGL